MRIVGGVRRGMRIDSPARQQIRPTSDRVRESLFNILGQRLEHVSFLDLCSGTGAVGIEAASRGARVTCVESRADALQLLQRNVRRSGLDIRVLHADALELIRRHRGSPWQLIFADPPWADEIDRQLLDAPELTSCLDIRGQLVIEHPRQRQLEPGSRWNCRDHRRYGSTSLSFFELRGGAPSA